MGEVKIEARAVAKKFGFSPAMSLALLPYTSKMRKALAGSVPNPFSSSVLILAAVIPGWGFKSSWIKRRREMALIPIRGGRTRCLCPLGGVYWPCPPKSADKWHVVEYSIALQRRPLRGALKRHREMALSGYERTDNSVNARPFAGGVTEGSTAVIRTGRRLVWGRWMNARAGRRGYVELHSLIPACIFSP